MRLMEALRLRAKDIDFSRNELTIREAKGDKDRVSVLPQRVRPLLQRHLALCRQRHAAESKEGRGRVRLPHAMDRKYPGAGQGWQWQCLLLLCCGTFVSSHLQCN